MPNTMHILYLSLLTLDTALPVCHQFYLLPLGTSAPVQPIPGQNIVFQPASGNNFTNGTFTVDTGGFGTILTPGPAALPNSLRWFNTALVADLTDATAATINDLR